MASKHTIAPRGALLESHLHRGVVARRKRVTASSAERPMRTVCAWCVEHDRPAAVLVDVPIDDRGLSHGICQSCLALLRSDSWAVGGSSDTSSTWR